ncbi:S8 family serine peptidase [uncultured Algibacter sp.]|uniref:S8 family serine peptidase n=1 Tax=uncultured Algibacter sp. TaxID=298659 RepID=UPI00263382EC|nr:S8 family serine peptidase [uncultured Algibacter sp.]
MKRGCCFLICLIIFFDVFPQEDAWVYFTDKENVAASINNPISILTQKAIDRKAKHDVSIDARDVPVNEGYIEQIKNATGISVKAKSKWFNAVHIRGLKTDVDNLVSDPDLNFIERIVYADKSLNLKKHSKKKPEILHNKFEFVNTLVNFTFGDTQNQLEMIHVNDLHFDGYTGEGITIAVLDAAFTNVNTMSAFQRLRDAGHLLGGYDFVDRTSAIYHYNPTPVSISHGTQVLSTMAGFIENSYVGTAPDASYYLFRTEDNNDENPVEESYWVEAAERADSLGVDILNTSLGYKDYSPNYTRYSYDASEMNGNTTFITKGANIAFEKGLLLVTSIGNSGSSGLGAPADSPNVLSVGAVNLNGDYAPFSSIGSAVQPSQKPDVVARGEAPYLVDVNDNIVQNSGTSFSGPIMAGGIACLMQALPNKTNIEIMNLVRKAGSQYEMPDYKLGYGIPNLYQAFEDALSIGDFGNEHIKIYPNPITAELFVNLSSNYKNVSFQLYDTLGKLIFNSIIESPFSMNLSNLHQGIYVAKIHLNGDVKTFKLIKK